MFALFWLFFPRGGGGACHFQPRHKAQYGFNEGRSGQVDQKQLRSEPRGTPSFSQICFFCFLFKTFISFLPVVSQFGQRRACLTPQVLASHFQSTRLVTQRAAARIRAAQTDEAFRKKLNWTRREEDKAAASWRNGNTQRCKSWCGELGARRHRRVGGCLAERTHKKNKPFWL